MRRRSSALEVSKTEMVGCKKSSRNWSCLHGAKIEEAVKLVRRKKREKFGGVGGEGGVERALVSFWRGAGTGGHEMIGWRISVSQLQVPAS